MGLIPPGGILSTFVLPFFMVTALFSVVETYKISLSCHTSALSCYTLGDIARISTTNPFSDNELIFSPGEHSLVGERVAITNVENLTFVGFDTASVPKILCTNSSFLFSNVSNLRFVNLELVSCEITLSSVLATFNNTTFKGGCSNQGGAMAIYNESNVSFIGQTSFIENKGIFAGGAIFSNRSTLSFSDLVKFEDNWSGLGGGGAVFAFHSEMNFTGVTKFTENRLTLVHCNNSNTTAAVSLIEISGGGAVYAVDSNFVFDGQTEFTNNRVGLERHGGGVYANGSVMNYTGHTSFVNNSASRGNGVYGNHSDISFHGTTLFTSAYNASGGGAMYLLENCALTVEGDTTFDNNSAGLGGALYVWQNNTVWFDGQTDFTNNVAIRGGAIRVSESDNLTFSGITQFINNTVTYKGGALDFDHYIHANFNNISVFKNNTARRGGAIVSLDGNFVQFDGNHTFLKNSADLGGAIDSKVGSVYNFSGDCYFISNTARFGAGIYMTTGGLLSMNGHISFIGNNASYVGGGLGVRDSSVNLTGTIDIVENTAKLGGGLLLQDARLELRGSGRFTSNVAKIEGYGGAVFASGSVVHFHGEEWRFVANKARYGAAIALAGLEGKLLYFHPLSYLNVTLHFEDNFAHQRGGAIYVESNSFSYCEFEGRTQTLNSCFMQHVQEACQPEEPTMPKRSYFDGIHLSFVNNTAGEIGNVLHGGSLYSCEWCVNVDQYIMGITAFHYVANITNDITQVPNLSSDPFIMETCEGNSSQAISLYPKQTITLSALAHGQNGTTPTIVRANTSPGVNLSDTYAILQLVGRNCSELQYTLIQEFENVTEGWIQVYADKPCSTSGFPLTVSIKFLECPIGFSLFQGECHCAIRLQRFDVECQIQDQTILRRSNFWVGVTERNNRSGLVTYPHCPFDRCTKKHIRFPLNNTDLQCVNNHSGTLCGACQSGLSLALGSSRCLHCSNAFLALLIPFALAGILLVVFLFLLKITISTGVISGLVFYANILTINRDVFFPPEETNFLTVFIAWLNLELGIETCFVDGLDAYSKMWLEFLFPVYLWLLVGLVVLLANYSVTVAKLIGDTNPVSVLATLFLLSYIKVLRIILATFLAATLEYPDDETSVVWLLDGTVKYLSGKHAFLFTFSLLTFLLLSVPYSLVLLFGQWIEGKFRVRWIPPKYYLRLKAFIDAHHAPLKEKHRYWVGLLLLFRFLFLLLVVVLEAVRPQDPQVILLVMLVTLSGLQLWAWIVNGAYKNWYLDALEGSFVFNLLVLIGGSYQIALSGGDQAALVQTSVGVAFVTFLGIISYFVWKHPTLNSVRNCFSKSCRPSSTSASSNIVNETSPLVPSRDSEPLPPTFSVVGPPPRRLAFPDKGALREPLLESVVS